MTLSSLFSDSPTGHFLGTTVDSRRGEGAARAWVSREDVSLPIVMTIHSVRTIPEGGGGWVEFQCKRILGRLIIPYVITF